MNLLPSVKVSELNILSHELAAVKLVYILILGGHRIAVLTMAEELFLNAEVLCCFFWL